MVVDFPQEVVDEIIDRLADDEVTRVASLRGCSLISSQWPYRSQKHLFHKIRFTNINFLKWCERIRPGNDGPSLHVAILHYHTTLKESKRLVDGHRHLSSFTNLQKLHLREASLHGLTDEELSMCFKEMGCSVRSVSLRACKMTINDLASFVCQFTKLERLSIIDPIIPNAVFEDSVELPVFGGILELRYMLTDRGTRDFVHQLPLLPLAFHTVVLEAIHISLSAPISDLLATCRETLTRVDIRDHFVRSVNLTECDALREMHLNAEVINHLPSIIRTVTSPQLKEIRFILPDTSLEKHCDNLDEWELIDAEICALVDRIRPVGQEGWNLSVRFVIPSATDTGAGGNSAAQLLSAFSKHEYITLSIATDRTEVSRSLKRSTWIE